MNFVSLFRGTFAIAVVSALTSPAVSIADPYSANSALIVRQPRPSAAIAPYVSDPANLSRMSHDAALALLKKRVKYVFVIFQAKSIVRFVFRLVPWSPLSLLAAAVADSGLL